MRSLVVVENGSLTEYSSGLIAEQEAAVRIAEEITRIANERNLPVPKESLRTLKVGQARLRALNAGFLPTSGLRTAVIPTRPLRKKKDGFDWKLRNQKRILTTINALPPQVKDAIAEAESLDMFDKISVSIPGGDPVIVGHAGGWKFLIASWVNLMDGHGVGFKTRMSV